MYILQYYWLNIHYMQYSKAGHGQVWSIEQTLLMLIELSSLIKL